MPTIRRRASSGGDIESRFQGNGKLRFIEVKGRVAGADTNYDFAKLFARGDAPR